MCQQYNKKCSIVTEKSSEQKVNEFIVRQWFYFTGSFHGKKKTENKVICGKCKPKYAALSQEKVINLNVQLKY